MSKFIAKNITHECDPTGGSTYAAIGQITSVDGPSEEVRTVETTTFSDDEATYLPTVVDNGEFSFEIMLDGTAHSPLTGLMTTPAVASWRTTFSDAKVYTYKGILTKFNPNGGGVDNAMTASCTIKISGAVTIA